METVLGDLLDLAVWCGIIIIAITSLAVLSAKLLNFPTARYNDMIALKVAIVGVYNFFVHF